MNILQNDDQTETLRRAAIAVNGCSVVKISQNIVNVSNRTGIGLVNSYNDKVHIIV